MNNIKLYRKRLIPAECIYLKDDILLYLDASKIITKWNAIRPRADLDHGYSYYILDKGIKLSKFYNSKNELLYLYFDIIHDTYHPEDQSHIFTDLLVDVIVYPDGKVKVVDLDELADAFEQKLITSEELLQSLRQLNELLTIIDSNQLSVYTDFLEQFET